VALMPRKSRRAWAISTESRCFNEAVALMPRKSLAPVGDAAAARMLQ
jgi:hypothetical protein